MPVSVDARLSGGPSVLRYYIKIVEEIIPLATIFEMQSRISSAMVVSVGK